MTIKFGTKALRALAISAAAFGMTTAANAAYVFDFTGSNWEGATGAARTFTGVGNGADSGKTMQVRVTAWSLDSGDKLNDAALGRWDKGLGVSSQSDNYHYVDNAGRKDFLLFEFASDVEMTTAFFNPFDVQTGTDRWGRPIYSKDSDATVSVGNIAANKDPANGDTLSKYALADYWNSDGPSTAGSRDINPGDLAGNLWMIGAKFGDNNDGFKLGSLTVLTAPTPAVPEPATWAMMITGFGFVGSSMRRRGTKTVAQTA